MDVESCPHLSSLSLCLPPSLFLSLSLPARHSFPLSSLSYAVSPPSVSPGAHSGSSCLLTNYRSWHQDLLPGLCRGASFMQVRCISLNLWISVRFNLSKLFTFCLFLRLCHCWSVHSLLFFCTVPINLLQRQGLHSATPHFSMNSSVRDYVILNAVLPTWAYAIQV